MKVAFAGSFAARVAQPVRARLSLPCEVMLGDEAALVPQLAKVDVLVSMGFSARMAEAAPRLRLVQVPGAGLDQIDRGALRPGTRLANAYGHEAGIAEYVIGAMVALTRSFGRLDARLAKAIGRVSGRLARPRRHSGRSWPERPWASSGWVTSGRRSPAARQPSTCGCAPFGGKPRRTRRAVCCS